MTADEIAETLSEAQRELDVMTKRAERAEGALRGCRRAVASMSDEPRRNVRELVDDYFEPDAHVRAALAKAGAR